MKKYQLLIVGLEQNQQTEKNSLYVQKGNTVELSDFVPTCLL